MYFFFELIILFAIPDSTVATSITQTIMIVAETSYLGNFQAIYLGLSLATALNEVKTPNTWPLLALCLIGRFFDSNVSNLAFAVCTCVFASSECEFD